MKAIQNVKAGTKATGSFIKRHWKPIAVGVVAALGAVGAAVGITAAKGHKSDAPETTDEPSDEPSEE